MMQHQGYQSPNGMQTGSTAATAVLQQAETWSRAQCDLLSSIEAICSRWMQWQREAIDAAGQSLVAISESRDLGSIFDIQQQWFADAARRTTSNWSALTKDATELTWRAARVDSTSDQTRSASPTTEQRHAGERASVHREAAE
jgi:hypothetical protein